MCRSWLVEGIMRGEVFEWLIVRSPASNPGADDMRLHLV
jgi:hypothetical protein